MKTIFEKLVDKMITPTTILDSEREYLKKVIDDYYEGVRESKRLSTEFGCKSSNDKERKELLLTYVPDLDEFKGFSKHRLENEGVSYSLTKWASIYENANKKELDWVCQGFENEVDTNLNEIQNSIDCLAYLKRLEQKYSSSFKRENQIELSRILESSIRTLSIKDKNENEEQIRIDIDILNFVYEISIYVEVVVNRYINIYDKICSPPQNTESNISKTGEKQHSTENVAEVQRKKQPTPKYDNLITEFKKKMCEQNMTQGRALTSIVRNAVELNGVEKSKKDKFREILYDVGLWKKGVKKA